VRRLVVAALVGALVAPAVASVAGADIFKGTGVETSSKGWTVELDIASWTLRSGSSMNATLTIDNRTGRGVRLSTCLNNGAFTMGIGNARAPFQAMNGAMVCSMVLHPGRNVFHERIRATYSACAPSGDLPRCGPHRSMPGLPPGIYRTVVTWEGLPSTIPRPGLLLVSVTR
jgi:hypothetical protein